MPGEDSADEIRVRRLEERFKRFSIIGGPEVEVSGSFQQGFAVNFRRLGSGAGAGETGPTGPTGPPEQTGACCLGEDCEVLTAADCAAGGGIYQGDFTECDPNPCNSGACCRDGACSEGSEASCFELGGIYQGDDTTCSPNPCTSGSCCFGIDCVGPISQSDCETADGVYLGDGSTCDEGCPSGACCFGADCFEGYSARTCADAAGTYQGDFSSCDPNPCPKACPTITMTCDSEAASGSKCGFEDAGKKYLTRLVVDEYSGASMFGPGPCQDDIGPGPPDFRRLTWNWDWSIVAVTSQQIDAMTCRGLGGGCLASGTYSITRNDPFPPCEEYPACTTHTGSVFECPTCAFLSCNIHAGDPCGELFVGLPITHFEFADEFTTEMLISIVEGRLNYSGSYTGGACASSKFLSSDELTYSVQRSKPKFDFSAVDNDFLLCYNEVFTPSGGGGGGGSTINTQCIFVSAGETTVYGPELLEPPSNGTISIQDINCTAL